MTDETDYVAQPNQHQLDTLATASNFAMQCWHNPKLNCPEFLQHYPLTTVLSNDDIERLLAQHTSLSFSKQSSSSPSSSSQSSSSLSSLNSSNLAASQHTTNDITDSSPSHTTQHISTNWASEAEVMQGLRQLRNKLMMRWIWQDALGKLSLEQLTGELSYFADCCISFAKNYCYHQLVLKYGHPSIKHKKTQYINDDMAVIAMGKLGANELNLSSDIDLIFVHKGHGYTNISTNADDDHNPNLKSIDNKRFMTRLGQGIIKLLDTVTQDGFVFRVDMRLRPWGDGSDLAIHQPALARYFSQHGRDWERFAWMKARIVNQPLDDEFVQSLQQIIRPFVFRHYVDYSAFSALREMKSLIQSQVAQREDSNNIKLGEGGIRDVEFIVQALQLIYGGRHPQLQVKPCLLAMQQLNQLKFLDDDTYQNLNTAYRFLRRLEHGIQAIDDQQTQQLPSDATAQQNLAKTLAQTLGQTHGFDTWETLIATLDDYRSTVSQPFAQMVVQRQTQDLPKHRSEHPSHPSNNTQTSITELITQLTPHLTDDNQNKLQTFLTSKLVNTLSKEAHKRLDTALPVVIQALLAYTLPTSTQSVPSGVKNNVHASTNTHLTSTQQDITSTINTDTINTENSADTINLALPGLLKLLEAICRRSIYLVMLAENPNEIQHLVPILAASPWITNELVRYPVLLDTFLQQRYQHLPNQDELINILQQRLLRVEANDEEALLSVLRLFKKMQVLAVAGSDLINELPIMQVSDSLTQIAEVVLTTVLTRAFAELVRRHGYPIGMDGNPVHETHCGFAIIGYGKLGGIEMSYSSDLDLVFLHQIKENAVTDGDKPISGMRFAAKLAQKIMTYLNTQTRDGRAYEIDMRLRPSGNAGMMVVSTHAFKIYQMQKAWAWEHQALVRARAICGDAMVITTFEQIRQDVLTQPRDIHSVQVEVAKMRHKMRDHLGTDNTTKSSHTQEVDTANKASIFHLKQDAGGMVDIEFMAQFGVLAYAHQYPELTKWQDNVRIFAAMATANIWTHSRCQALTEAYLSIRQTTHQLALANKKLLVNDTPWQKMREQVIAHWHEVIETD